MFSPRLFGSFILLYVSLFKFWEFLGFVGGATLGGRISGTIGYALLILLGFVLLSYIVGGLGLIMRRTWSATVVFYAAIVEAAIILFGATAILYAVLEGTQVSLGNLTVLSVLPILMYLVIPGGIAYVARSLQKKPELWQPSQQKSAGELETGYAIQVEPQQPAWLRKTFWVITVTGLVLPAIMGMIVTTLLLSQGKQAEVSGYDLFFFIFGTVLFALPYIVLSFIARSILMKAVADGGYQPVKRLFVIAGIFLGMTLFIAWNLFTYFRHGETAAVLILAPFIPFFAALPGAIVGAVVGLSGYFLWRRTRR